MNVRRRLAAVVFGAAVVLGGAVAGASAAPVPLPDFTVRHPGGTVTAGRGADGQVDLDVENESSTPDATGVLTVTFPSGLTPTAHPLSQQGYSDPTCTRAGSVLTCPLQHMNTFDGSDISVSFAAARTLAIGSHPQIGVTFTPTGGDEHPDDNTATIPVTILGLADLVYDVSLPGTTVTVGKQVTGTATIMNRGPDPATNAYVYLGVLAQPGEVSVRVPGATIPSGPNQAAIGKVSLGTVPVGATVTRSVFITVRKLDKSGYSFLINGAAEGEQSSTVDPHVQCDGRACNAAASVLFHAVRSSPSSSGPAGTSGGSPSGTVSAAPLAATGAPAGVLGLTGLALLVSGAWLCLVGRRRRAFVRAH